MACIPLPHSRFTVIAGVPTRQAAVDGRHPGMYMSLFSVWITLPNTT